MAALYSFLERRTYSELLWRFSIALGVAVLLVVVACFSARAIQRAYGSFFITKSTRHKIALSVFALSVVAASTAYYAVLIPYVEDRIVPRTDHWMSRHDFIVRARGVEAKWPEESQVAQWADFLAWGEYPNHLFLVSRPTLGFVLPKRFYSAKEIEQLRSLFQEMIGPRDGN